MASFFRHRMEEVLIVIGANRISHFINGPRRNARCRHKPDKVSDIPCPAAKIGSTLILCVIRHVQTAKHMPKINFIPIGQCELLDILER